MDNKDTMGWFAITIDQKSKKILEYASNNEKTVELIKEHIQKENINGENPEVL